MSSHTLAKLIYMANQIAVAFRTEGHDQAVEATWDHLWHFWDPRMRSMIVAHLAAGGEGLNEIARDAVRLLGHPDKPAPQSKATQFNKADDHDTGRNLMSDAG